MPHCEALSGRIIFLFRAERLIDEHVEDALTDFALMQVLAFPLVQLDCSGSRFEQPPVLDMGYAESLHG